MIKVLPRLSRLDMVTSHRSPLIDHRSSFPHKRGSQEEAEQRHVTSFLTYHWSAGPVTQKENKAWTSCEAPAQTIRAPAVPEKEDDDARICVKQGKNTPGLRSPRLAAACRRTSRALAILQPLGFAVGFFEPPERRVTL